MTARQKHIIILLVIIITGLALGRLAVRVFMNMLLGGTIYGGNFL